MIILPLNCDLFADFPVPKTKVTEEKAAQIRHRTAGPPLHDRYTPEK
jgi:hypothetical protein